MYNTVQRCWAAFQTVRLLSTLHPAKVGQQMSHRGFRDRGFNHRAASGTVASTIVASGTVASTIVASGTVASTILASEIAVFGNHGLRDCGFKDRGFRDRDLATSRMALQGKMSTSSRSTTVSPVVVLAMGTRALSYRRENTGQDTLYHRMETLFNKLPAFIPRCRVRRHGRLVTSR